MRLVLPLLLLERFVSGEQSPERHAVIGRPDPAGGLSWTVVGEGHPPAEALGADAVAGRFHCHLAASPIDRSAWSPPEGSGCHIHLGRGEWAGMVWGWAGSSGRWRELAEIFLPGPGMRRIHPAEPLGRPSRHGLDPRWSRTRGALGEEVLDRLQTLSAAVVGCGRSGSIMAEHLVRIGLDSVLLLDGDLVEPHNLGEGSLLGGKSLGLPKAQALHKELYPLASEAGVRVVPIPEPLPTARTLPALQACDLVFTCVDNDRARAWAAFTAAWGNQVLFDLGTGALDSGAWGADVRMVVPGDGCLVCSGGLADPGALGAAEATHAAQPPRPSVAPADGRQGSLRSLNAIACAMALRLLEDLVAERARATAWLRYESGPSGLQQIQSMPLARARGCAWCLRGGLSPSKSGQ